jgi:hypothetical protein
LVGFSDDGRSAFVVTGHGLVTRADGKETWPFQQDFHQGGRFFQPMTLSPGGRFLLCAFMLPDNGDRVYRVVDLKDGGKAGELRGQQYHIQVAARQVALSADGKTLAAAVHRNQALRELHRIDVATGKPLGAPIKSKQDFFLFGPGDGKTLLVFDTAAAALWRWDVATGKRVGEVLAFQPPLHGAALAPDGKTALVCTAATGVRVWDLATGKPRGEPLRPAGTRSNVYWSPDGRTLAAREYGSAGREIRLWDAATLKPLGPVVPSDKQYVEEDESKRFAFSPDGRRFTTVFGGRLTIHDVPQALRGDAERLRLWVEVNTGKELDAGGALVDLTPPEWRQRREQLQKLGGLAE